jgi:hypothetical protein
VGVLYASDKSSWPFRLVFTSSAGMWLSSSIKLTWLFRLSSACMWRSSMLSSSRFDHLALFSHSQVVWSCCWFFI